MALPAFDSCGSDLISFKIFDLLDPFKIVEFSSPAEWLLTASAELGLRIVAIPLLLTLSLPASFVGFKMEKGRRAHIRAYTMWMFWR